MSPPVLPDQGPLSASELAQLEATLLPALERHHLRLLAHGLRTLQAIAGGSQGALPGRGAIETWALAQVAVGGDAGFARALAEQLLGAADQLQAIGATCGQEALDVGLEELCAWARRQADQRLAIIPPTTQLP